MKRLATMVTVAVAGAVLLAAPMAHAYNTFNTTFTDPAGLTFGTYLGGAEGYGRSNPVTFVYDITAKDGGDPFGGNANGRDWFWVQDQSGPFDAANLGLRFDLGGQANQVVVFPIIDHGPIGPESWEYNVWLSNDQVTWTAATLTDIYTEGWSANPDVADGYTTVWKLGAGQTARYASITAGNNGNPDPSFYYDSFDNEIDAIAGLTERGGSVNPTPEPGTLAFLGFGLLGVGALASRRK